MTEHNDLPANEPHQTQAPAAAPPALPLDVTACPRCGSAMRPAEHDATTFCSCGFAAPSSQIKEMNYLRAGLPQWQQRLNYLDAQVREQGVAVDPAVMQEALQLRQGMPAWQARLDLLTDALNRGAGSGAAAAVPATEEFGSSAPKISAYRLVLTLGALLFISGAAALSFYIGRNFGAYAQLTMLLFLCVAFGWGSVASRERTRSTSTALSAITVGGWVFTMIWFGYKLVGAEFWRMTSPVAMGLAALTAVVLLAAGRRTRTDLWVFSGYMSGTLTVSLACLYLATTVQRLGAVSPAVGNAVVTLPLSLMAALALQDRLRLFQDRTGARLTSAYFALTVAVAVAIPSLTAYLFSPEDAEFDTRGWQSAGLLTWSAHLAAVCVLLYRSKQRTSPITTATALGAGLLFTGGIRALDFDLGFWSGVPTAIGALAITVGILYAIRSQADNQPEIRTLIAIFGAIGWLAFLVSTNTPAQVNLGAWVWSAHAGVLAWLLQRRQKIMASSIAAIIALSWLAASRIGDSWVMDLPRSIAFGFCLLPFAAGLVLIVRKGTWVAGGWPVPAIAALLFANISSNSERYFVGILPIPLIPEEADVASNTAAAAMLVASVAIAVFVNRSKHLAGAIAGALLSGSGLHLLVRSADLDPLEKWTIPFGASALLFGFLAKRINPELNSAAWLSPAAFTLTLPSALISLNQPAGLRLYVVVAAVVACLALGLVTNYAGLLLPGSIGTVLVTLQPVVHQSGAAAPFISLLLGGGTLIALGWKFERLRNRDGFKSLR